MPALFHEVKPGAEPEQNCPCIVVAGLHSFYSAMEQSSPPRWDTSQWDMLIRMEVSIQPGGPHVSGRCSESLGMLVVLVTLHSSAVTSNVYL